LDSKINISMGAEILRVILAHFSILGKSSIQKKTTKNMEKLMDFSENSNKKRCWGLYKFIQT
jgi:hypothetical protein